MGRHKRTLARERHGHHDDPDLYMYRKGQHMSAERAVVLVERGLDPRSAYPLCDVCMQHQGTQWNHWTVCNICRRRSIVRHLRSLQDTTPLYQAHVGSPTMQVTTAAQHLRRRAVDARLRLLQLAGERTGE